MVLRLMAHLFPFLPLDFDMSDAQQEHALAIERLAPRLMALRIELCPCHMSEGYFWKVYFVLLHSRLNKKDAEVLSTTQVSYPFLCMRPRKVSISGIHVVFYANKFCHCLSSLL